MIHVRNLRKLRRAADGVPATELLLLLVLTDWLVARALESPASFFAWLAELPEPVEFVFSPDPITDALGAFLTSPYFASILVALTLIFWLFDVRRLLLVPLAIYNVWATIIALASVALVAINLFNPNTEAEILLTDTFIVWISNWVVFAVWYWLLDHAGQERHVGGTPVRLHFVFPQTGSAMPAWETWRPRTFDYLFLSFIIMAQFGPSDTIPLTRRAKAIVMMQTVIALVTVTLIASRAIGIVK
jgi:hypothetical protein